MLLIVIVYGNTFIKYILEADKVDKEVDKEDKAVGKVLIMAIFS